MHDEVMSGNIDTWRDSMETNLDGVFSIRVDANAPVEYDLIGRSQTYSAKFELSDCAENSAGRN